MEFGTTEELATRMTDRSNVVLFTHHPGRWTAFYSVCWKQSNWKRNDLGPLCTRICCVTFSWLSTIKKRGQSGRAMI